MRGCIDWFLSSRQDKNVVKNKHFFESLYNLCVQIISVRVHSKMMQPRSLFRRVRIRGLEMFVFSENLTCFVFLKHPFWDSPFCLITNDFTDYSPSPLSQPKEWYKYRTNKRIQVIINFYIFRWVHRFFYIILTYIIKLKTTQAKSEGIT